MVNVLMVGMKLVPTEFILHPYQDKDGAGHANGEAEKIDKGKCLVLPDTSPCYFEI
jgi:hypothetical protein